MGDVEEIAILGIIHELITDKEIEIIQYLDDNKRKHRYWVRPWIVDRESEEHQNTGFKLQEELILYDDTFEFRLMLRMTPDVYFAILEQISPLIRKADTNFRRSIPPEQRLSITLKYLAFGEEPASLAQTYRIGRCTVGRIIKETCEAIYTQFHDEYIHTPSTALEWMQVANDFIQKWNYPACMGALDGKHFRITCPSKSGSTYFNYKKYFSIVLMALCNANYEFIYIDVGAEGKAADGGIFKEYSLKYALDNNDLDVPKLFNLPGTEENIPYHIVADNAFALSTYLQKPYCRRHLSNRELVFNYRLSRARRIVENCFGILSSRFHIFRHEINMNPESVTSVVLAGVTLHNILRKCCGNAYITNTIVDREDANHNVIEGDWRRQQQFDSMSVGNFNRNPPKNAKEIRELLSDYFLTPFGEVGWQYNQITHGK